MMRVFELFILMQMTAYQPNILLVTTNCRFVCASCFIIMLNNNDDDDHHHDDVESVFRLPHRIY